MNFAFVNSVVRHGDSSRGLKRYTMKVIYAKVVKLAVINVVVCHG